MPDSSITYACQRCARCCRWPGEVKVSTAEIDAIADFLKMPVPEMIERHTRLRDNRRGLTLLEKPNGECEFLDGNDCRLQTVKPQQCRDFPNKWRFPGWRQVCEAIPIRIPAESASQPGHDFTEKSN